MTLAQLKIAEIAQLLEQSDVPLHILETLRTDSRSSVTRLLARWQAKNERLAQERVRLQQLFVHETHYYDTGYQYIAGVDEAGRGPLAGPVVVAAVILPPNAYLPGLNDSKQLSVKQRESLYHSIHDIAMAVNYQVIPVETIDQVNIYQATMLGMYQVIDKLEPSAQAVLIDAVKLPALAIPSVSIIGGDQVSASIAAASIIAKVERDRIMQMLHEQYPIYGFDKHKGYGTREHLAALHEHGPCPVHRRSFGPVKRRYESGD